MFKAILMTWVNTPAEDKIQMNMSGFKKSTTPVIQLLGVILLSILTSGCQHLTFFPDLSENLSFQEEDGQQKPQPQTETIEAHEFQLADGQTMVGTIAAANTRENDTLSDIARHFGLGL
jgi:L,D-transpeptidase ErfK/SrfK